MRTDSYLHKGRRKKLVEKLIERGITDINVLNTIEQIPRHFFLDSAFEQHAYEDKPFSIGEGQTISQPYTVAFQTQLLNVKKGDKILEVGTGSGYQASVLSVLNAEVFTIEYNKNLYFKTKKLIKELKYKKIHCFLGDGSKGLEEHAPYDKIIVTAGATEEIPIPLLKQLKVGGVLVIPTGDEKSQKMMRIFKNENEYQTEMFENFQFVPLRGEFGWK